MLFETMHEMKWFKAILLPAKSKNAELRLYKSIRCLILLDPGKDEDAIAYLTQALVARIQTLKQEEPEQNTRSLGMTKIGRAHV